MTAATRPVPFNNRGDYPRITSYPLAGNTLIEKGWLVEITAAGLAQPAGTTAGLRIAGWAESSVDNRTAATGGAASAVSINVRAGVFGCKWTGGSTPKANDIVFAVDNQTVSTDSDSASRGIAGIVTYTDTAAAETFVYMGPHVAGLIAIDVQVAADVVTAQADIDALQVDAATANAIWPIPLTSFTKADATPLGKHADGADTTFGLNLADSKALCIRWNNHATPGTALCEVALPKDLDDTADVILEVLASKSGATLGDATTFLVTAFFTTAGDLHDADTDCGGTTSALVGNATAKTTALVTLTLAAANVPANAASLTFTLKPTDGKLGTDDVMVHAVRLKYTRKLQTA